MSCEKKMIFFEKINYKTFKKLPKDIRIKYLIDNEVLVINKSRRLNNPHTQPLWFYYNRESLNPKDLLTETNFINYILEDKNYCISYDLIDEIRNYLFEDFKKNKDNYLHAIDNITIDLRKCAFKDEQKQILKKMHDKYITIFNNIDILNYLYEDNEYLDDRNEFLEPDFDNDLLFYDYDYIYYSIIYKNANHVFSYVFNVDWDTNKWKILNEILKFYHNKNIINFIKDELRKLNKHREEETKKTKLTLNQKVLLLEQIMKFKDDTWENLYNTKKADLLSLLLGGNSDNIRKKLTTLNKSYKNLSRQELEDTSRVNELIKILLG